MSVFHKNILIGSAEPTEVAEYQIDRSVRFNDGDSASLSKTFSSAGNRKTWTWSGWIKRGQISSEQYIVGAGTSDSLQITDIFFSSTDELSFYSSVSGAARADVKTNAKFRDASAWYHIIVAFDAGNSTAADRVKLYVNGVEQDVTTTTSVFDQDHEINNATDHYLGRRHNGNYLDGYMADVYFIDGQALDETSFGELDDDNVWRPKEYSGTYGTNGYHLDFSDNSSVSALGEDSANSNDWTVNNISVTAGTGNDSLIDTPTNYEPSSGNNAGNYCTWNPLDKDADVTVANGNLDMTQTGAGGVKGTIGVTSGKWYWEITKGGTANQVVGIATSDALPTTYAGGYAGSCGWAATTTTLFANANSIFSRSTTAKLSSYTTGDVIGLALDLDSATKTLKFYKNGTLETANHILIADSPLHILPVIGTNVADASANSANFGQRPFAYTPPTGHLSLCSTNLPASIADGSTAMDVVTDTGANILTTAQGAIGSSADLLWIKDRDNSNNHQIIDTVRGGTDALHANLTSTETAYSAPSGNSIAWTWDAASSTSSNTDGSITSSVRANPTAGFSIVTYTGTGSTATVGHGLNAAPGVIWVKNTSGATGYNWAVKHSFLTSDAYYIGLNTTSAEAALNAMWNSTAPTSSVFTIGTNTSVNSNTIEYVAYCFAPIPNYSTFNTYTGNNNVEGPFVCTGFRPKFLMIRGTNVNFWTLHDTEISPYNPADEYFIAQNTGAEGSASTDRIDIVSNGFKIRNTESRYNSSGQKYIYMAFAEHPLKTARAR